MSWLFSCLKGIIIVLKIQWREKSKEGGQLIFHSWTSAHKKLGIFMKHNCAQMLIFKQRRIRCTSFGCSALLILMKSLAREEGGYSTALGSEKLHELACLAETQHVG